MRFDVPVPHASNGFDPVAQRGELPTKMQQMHIKCASAASSAPYPVLEFSATDKTSSPHEDSQNSRFEYSFASGRNRSSVRSNVSTAS